MTLRATADNFGEPRFAATARRQMTVIAADSSEQLFDHEANTPVFARSLSGNRLPQANPHQTRQGRDPDRLRGVHERQITP